MHQNNLRKCLLFTSASLFSFWVLSHALISNAFYGVNLQLLFGVPLLVIGLSSLLPYIVKKNLNKKLVWFQLLAILSLPVALFAFPFAQNVLDSNFIDIANKSNDINNISSSAWRISFVNQLFFAVILAVPFFFYGAFLSYIFKLEVKSKVVKLYLFELIGLLTGLISISFFLDKLSLQWVISLIFIFSAISLYYTGNSVIKKIAIFIFPALIFVNFLSPTLFEPTRNPNWSARDYTNSLKKVEEKKRAWTTYSKVQLLKINDSHYNISIQDGMGHAQVPQLRNKALDSEAVTIGKIFGVKKALVLFAGGGYEIASFHKHFGNGVEATGVEINPKVLGFSLNHQDQILKNALKFENYKMVNSDGRVFLEHEKENYDFILYSWSGTSTAYFSTAEINTVQFMFTEEAFTAALKRLKPNGILAVFSGLKPNLMLTLYKAAKNNGMKNLSDSILIAGGDYENANKWTWIANTNITIFKHGKLTRDEVEKVNRNLFKHKSMNVLMSPYSKNEGKFHEIHEGLKSSDFETFKSKLRQSSGINYQAATDDHPFAYRTEIFKKYNFETLKNILSFDKKNLLLADIDWNLLRETIVLFLLLILFLGVLISFIKVKTTDYLVTSLLNVHIGFISTSIVILMTYKFILYIGNPTYGVVLPQAICFLFGAFGTTYVWRKGLGSGRLILNFLIGAPLILIILFFIFSASAMRSYLFTTFVGPLILALFLLPLFFMSSSLFSFILLKLKGAEFDLIPIYFSVNTLSAAAASFLIPALVDINGILSTFYFLLAVFVSLVIFSVINRKLFRT